MMKTRKICTLIGIAAAVVIVAYVAIFTFTEIEQRKALEDIQISFHEASLQDIDFSGATLNLSLSMYNPNDITATLDRVDYEIWFNDNYLGNGFTHERVDIPPLTSKIATTNFDLDFGGAGMAIISAITEEEYSWHITGTAFYDTIFGTMNIPFDITQ